MDESETGNILNTNQNNFIGKDEMNLVEFPITLLSRRHVSDQKTIEFSDCISGTNKEIIKREWILTGSDKFGLPLVQDNDIWLALLFLGKDQILNSRKIYFTRYEICQVLGWKPGGNKYQRIEDSLNRLASVSIFAKNSFWDNSKKSYVTKNFGIIDDYEIFDYGNKKERNDSSPSSYVNINEVVYESIKSGYIKNLSMNFYSSLSGDIAKRLFRYLDKKSYNKNRYEINLHDLAYTHMGMEEETYKYLSDITRKLTAAHNELIEKGFLQSAEYKETTSYKTFKVVYTFSDKKKMLQKVDQTKLFKICAEPKDQIRKSGNKTLDNLIEIGITEHVARQILKNYPEDKIKAQIEALPFRKAKDPAAILVKSIKEEWSPSSGYKNHIESKKRAANNKAKKEAEEKRNAERLEKIEKYLAKLSKKERKALENEAMVRAEHEGGEFVRKFGVNEGMLNAYISVLVEEKTTISRN